MVGLLMPVALLTVPLYLLFIKMHLVNTMWAMIIPSMVSPFGVFLGNVYADSSVPMELLEAARIDGAGELRIFSTMVLRLLAPAMVTIFDGAASNARVDPWQFGTCAGNPAPPAADGVGTWCPPPHADSRKAEVTAIPDRVLLRTIRPPRVPVLFGPPHR